MLTERGGIQDHDRGIERPVIEVSTQVEGPSVGIGGESRGLECAGIMRLTTGLNNPHACGACGFS